jgi:DNA polymerase-3 subunit chi
MPEALFYHLEHRSLEDVLPSLLEKTRERGWKANVRVGNAERLETLDTHLWTFSEQSFLAHGTAADGNPSRQPVYLTTETDNPNGADVLFLVDGARIADWRAGELKGFTRIVLLFDGQEEEALSVARNAWKNAKESGHEVTYWKETPNGRWERQA